MWREVLVIAWRQALPAWRLPQGRQTDSLVSDLESALNTSSEAPSYWLHFDKVKWISEPQLPSAYL